MTEILNLHSLSQVHSQKFIYRDHKSPLPTIQGIHFRSSNISTYENVWDHSCIIIIRSYIAIDGTLWFQQLIINTFTFSYIYEYFCKNVLIITDCILDLTNCSGLFWTQIVPFSIKICCIAICFYMLKFQGFSTVRNLYSFTSKLSYKLKKLYS